MKKLVLILAVIISLLSSAASAQFFPEEKFKSITELDSRWEKAQFIENSVPDEKRVITCEDGGTFQVFVGSAEGIDVRMCRVAMPKIIESQTTTIQVVINNSQRFSCPIKLSYQIFSEPKLIDDEIVIRVSIGMYDTTDSHFYLSFKKNGDWNTTAVSQKD